MGNGWWLYRYTGFTEDLVTRDKAHTSLRGTTGTYVVVKLLLDREFDEDTRYSMSHVHVLASYPAGKLTRHQQGLLESIGALQMKSYPAMEMAGVNAEEGKSLHVHWQHWLSIDWVNMCPLSPHLPVGNGYLDEPAIMVARFLSTKPSLYDVIQEGHEVLTHVVNNTLRKLLDPKR